MTTFEDKRYELLKEREELERRVRSATDELEEHYATYGDLEEEEEGGKA